MKTDVPSFTYRHLKSLQWAVHAAAAWRGSYVGNPDPVPLTEFDAAVRDCKVALKVLKQINQAKKGAK